MPPIGKLFFIMVPGGVHVSDAWLLLDSVHGFM